MKNLFCALVIIVSAINSFSQSENSPKLDYLIAGGGEHYGGYNFTMTGEESKIMLTSLVGQYSESKKKEKYIWKIKNIEIPGLDETVTLQIHQGLSGKRENFTGYFTTFMNETDKENKLAQKSDSEISSIIIYVKDGRKNALKNKEQAEIVKAYLLSIYG